MSDTAWISWREAVSWVEFHRECPVAEWMEGSISCETLGLEKLPARPALKPLPQSQQAEVIANLGGKRKWSVLSRTPGQHLRWERDKVPHCPAARLQSWKRRKKEGKRKGRKRERKREWGKRKQRRAYWLKTHRQEGGVWHQNPLYMFCCT